MEELFACSSHVQDVSKFSASSPEKSKDHFYQEEEENVLIIFLRCRNIIPTFTEFYVFLRGRASERSYKIEKFRAGRWDGQLPDF